MTSFTSEMKRVADSVILKSKQQQLKYEVIN